MTLSATLAVLIFVGAYVLLATEKVHRTKVALGGAALMLLLHITDAEKAFFDEHTGVEWNVIFLLLGMMIIVSVLRQTGVFEYIAILAAKSSRGKPYRLMVLLCVLTAVASAFLDNVTTVLLVAPVTFLVCERLGLKPVPFLIAEVMASNIGGAATLVGRPAEHHHRQPRRPELQRLPGAHGADHRRADGGVLPACAAGCSGQHFTFDAERAASVMSLNEREAIKDKTLLIRSLGVLALVVAAFVLHPVLHYEPSIVALLGRGPADPGHGRLDRRCPGRRRVADAGVLRRAVHHGGRTGRDRRDRGTVSGAMADATDGKLGLAAMILLFGSAGLSAIVDNIPYVATMSPVVADLVNAAGPDGQVLWWALALGADLGGNATAIGASANVVDARAGRAGRRTPSASGSSPSTASWSPW